MSEDPVRPPAVRPQDKPQDAIEVQMNKIRLTMTKSETYSPNNTQYRLDMAIESTDENLQDELFTVRRASPVESSSPGELPRDEFWGVCRYVDISTLGVGDPNEGQNFYLTNTWTLVFGNPETREEAVDTLKGDVIKLAREIGSFEDPDNSNEIVFEQDY